MQKRFPLLGLFIIVLLSLLGNLHADTPGSGTAIISPSSDVIAGSQGRWEIRYTATEVFQSGTLRFTIPDGWTAPQYAVPNQAGYVAVDDDAESTSVITSIIDRVITVTVDTLSTGNSVWIVYGEDSSGTNPNALATAQTSTESGVEFLVESDPAGSSPAPIAIPPTLDVISGPPASLKISPDSATVEAGVSEPYTVTVVDINGNSTGVAQNRTIALFPPSGSFYVGGSTRDTIHIATGQSSRNLDYEGEAAVSGFIVLMTADALLPLLTGVANVQVLPTDPDAVMSTVTATTNITADGLDQSEVTVTVRDEFGNTVEDVPVDLAILTGTAVIEVDPVSTDANGEALGYVTSTTAGDVTVQATADGLTITQTASISFIAGQADADSSSIEASPANNVTADGSDESTITITARDIHGNVVQGAGVTLTVFPAAGAILGQPTQATNASGQTTGSLKSTTVDDFTVKAIIDGTINLTDSVTVSFVPGPVDSVVSTVEATTDIIADGVAASTVTVTVSDAFGNVIDGASVAVEASGNANVTGSTGSTGADGKFVALVTNTTAETVQVFASAGGKALADTASVTFVADEVDGSRSLIDALPLSVEANGTSSSTITVTALDANDNPVSGKTVSLSVTPDDGIVELNSPGGVTGANGEASGSILSTRARDYVIMAVIDGTVQVDDSVTVTFTPGAAASFEWSSLPAPGRAGDWESVTLTVYDIQSNVITDYDQEVTLTTNGSSFIDWGIGSGSGSIINDPGDQARYTFDPLDGGIVTLTVRDTLAETIRLFANATGASGFSDEITIDHNVAAQIQIVAGNNQDATVFTDVATPPKVRITDTFGNAVDNEQVTFTLILDSDGGSIDVDTGGGVANDSTGFTDAAGEIECERWTLGRTAGLNSNRLRARNSIGAVYFDATGNPDVAKNVDITPATGSVTVDEYQVTTVTVTDQYDNTVKDQYVEVFIPGTADGTLHSNPGDLNPTYQITQTSRYGETDNSGRITVRYRAPGTAGLTDNVDATAAPYVTDPDSVTDAVYTSSAAGEGTELKISFPDGSTTTAGTPLRVTIEAVDSNDNVDLTDSSTVNITGETGSLLQFSETIDFAVRTTQVTLVNGSLTIYAQTANAGNWDIGLEDDAHLLVPTFGEITVNDTNTISDYLVQASTANVTAGVSFNVTITALDPYGNRVMNASSSVNLDAVEAADSTAVLPTDPLWTQQTNLVAGQAVVGERYTTAEAIRVRASDGSSNQGFSGTVGVGPASAYRLEKISPPDTSGVEAGSQLQIIAEVLDNFGNTVPNEPVTFFNPEGGGNFTGQPSVVDSTALNGRAEVTYTTGPVVGDNRVVAQILNGDPPGLERKEYFISTEAGVIDSLLVTLGSTSMTAGDSIDVTISAFSNGNLVENDDTTVLDLGTSTLNATIQPTATLTAGVASAKVTDTFVEQFFVSAQVQGGGPSDNSPLITVTNAPAYQIHYVRGDTSGLTVGSEQPLVVDVEDEYGNDVPNHYVHFYVSSSPGGASLASNGFVLTDGNGRAVDTLTTSNLAGDNVIVAEIYDGIPPAREKYTFTVSTVAGEIDSYQVVTDVSTQTVGDPVEIAVRAFDANGNLVIEDSSTDVWISLNLGMGWGPVFATLTAGTLQTTMVNTVAGDKRIRAQTIGDPSEWGESGIVTLTPDEPWGDGSISIIVNPDTITATELTVSQCTTSVVRDQYGNQSSMGELITVSITPGSIDTPDQDAGTPGNQQEVDADGVVTFQVRSDTTVGDAVIDASSVRGTATGTGAIHFAEPPGFVCPSAPNPNSIIIGQPYRFYVLAENTSSTTVRLSTSTVFRFTDGTTEFEASLSAEKSLSAGDTTTLAFDNTIVSLAMTPGLYQPRVRFLGVDEFDAPFSVNSDLPAQSLRVSAIQITNIIPPPPRSIGQTDTVRVEIENPSPDDAVLTDVTLTFAPPTGNFIQLVSPDASSIIAGNGGMLSYRVPVTIDDGTAPDQYTIDARVTAQVGGNTVVDDSLDPFPLPEWTVQSAVSLTYIVDSLDPFSVSRGQTHAFSVDIHNNGQPTVTFDTTSTKVHFTDGITSYTANIQQGKAISGGSTESIEFKATQIPAALRDSTTYDVTIFIAGKENDSPFADTLTTAPGDYLTVQTPAAVIEPPDALYPPRVSTKSSLTFTVDLINSGTASVQLTPAATTISFSTFQADLDPTETTVLSPGPNTLTFLAEIVEETISPDTYFPSIHLEGFENGIAFLENITLSDSIVVEVAPEVNIVSIETSQPSITAGRAYSIDVWMIVENNGGATVRFTDASIEFILGGLDRTGEYAITQPTSFNGGRQDLPGGGIVDTVTFTVETSSVVTVGDQTIQGNLEVLDLNVTEPVYANTDAGGKGSLLVQSQATMSIESITPELDPVTRDMMVPFEIEMLVRNEGGSDIQVILDDLNTALSFGPSAGWMSSVRSVFANGDSVLSAGESGTVVFDIGRVGSQSGTTLIGADISSTELNSGFAVDLTTGGPGYTSITVQDSARIVISNIQLSRSTLTNDSEVPWQIQMDVTNAGGASVDLSLPASFALDFEGALIDPVWTQPSKLEGGGTLLLSGQTDQLVVPLDNTGLYDLSGSLDKTIDVTFLGTEPSTGITHLGSGNIVVTIQESPSVVYTPATLQPDTVSRGASVEFILPISNPHPNAATIELNRSTTELSFYGGFFDVGLQPSSPGEIPGGPTPVNLVFESEVISRDIPIGPQTDVVAHLVWTENGRADSLDMAIPSTDLIVQDTPDLNIVGIFPQRDAATFYQPPWTILMVLENKQDAARVGLDLSQDATRLSFKTLVGDQVVTPQYDIIQPTALKEAGDTILAGGQIDTLEFIVNSTGRTAGTIIVSGEVVGTDLNSNDPVFDNTTDGGDGNFLVQSPAVLQIDSIIPEQSTATVSQTGQYTIEMAVLNDGGSTVDLNLDNTNTYLTFDGSGGWNVDVQAALAGGGTELAGGETDVVTFTVSTSGNIPGTTTIRGFVSGTVVNTGMPIADDTDDGGASTIDLQTPADITITNVTPSRETVTDSPPVPVPWDITVTLVNSGGSDAELELPSSLTVDIPDGSIVFDAVDELDEGGLLLDRNGGTGTLTIHVTSTGPFSSWGFKDINVDLDAVERNSNRTFSVATGQGSVTVQRVPVLNVTNLTPNVVSSGAVVGFVVDVTNTDPLAATADLDRAQTRLHFDTGNFSAFLDLTSPLSIDGGTTEQIRFDAKLIGPAIDASTYDVNVDLFWTENGSPESAFFMLTNGLVVQAAPVLSITELIASRSEVTAGQANVATQWTVTMNVHNGGDAVLDLDLDPANTNIDFNLAGGGTDATYILNRPDSLSAGGIRLNGGESGELVYTVVRTGDSTGVIQISGKVEGVDPFTSDRFSYETGFGGSTVITVQSPALLDITEITTNPPTVTTGQAVWFVRVEIENKGESAVNLDFDNSRVWFETDTPNWIVQRPRLPGGGNTLPGSSSDVLLFEVDQAGTNGNWRIDGYVEGTEINSADLRTDTTDTSGYGSIEVQLPPQIQLVSTTIEAPRTPFVNGGQSFGIRAEVTNATSVADAQDVRLRILQSGDSVLPIPADYVFSSVPAGSTVVHVFPVTAGTAETTDTFTVRTLGALDANSEQPVVPLTPSDSIATAQIQIPAELEIESVCPDQPNVTRQQTTPWDIIVAIKNNGTAPLELDPPERDDIRFFLGLSEKTDYFVTPPSEFKSKRPDWIVDGLGIDTLVYTVSPTGADTGTVTIEATLGATDQNTLARILPEPVDSGYVHVQAASGLFVKSTVTDSTFNNPSASMSVVNTGQSYKILVNVKNTGEAVDSVRVQLNSDSMSVISGPRGLVKRSIETGDNTTYIFDVTADTSPHTFETFIATIHDAISRNTQQPVEPSRAEDEQQIVKTETRSNLTIDPFRISSPPSVSGDTLSTGQPIQVTATIKNRGQADLTTNGEITLVAMEFTFVDHDSVRTFDLGSEESLDITWNLIAPEAPGTSDLACRITGIPVDRNDEQLADTTDASKLLRATVVEADYVFGPVYVSTPQGARDNIVSTDQYFRVVISVTPSEALENVTATINLPRGFLIDGLTTVDLGDGDGVTMYVDSFSVQAPSGATSGPEDITFTASGTDKNTGNIVEDTSQALQVTAVAKASLRIDIEINQPVESRDSTVTIGSTFTLGAVVYNDGDAGVDTTGARLSIEMPPTANYSLTNGSSPQSPFTPGDSVIWDIQAPPQASGPDVFTIRISGVPADSNTNAPAEVTVVQRTVPIVTEGAAVTMDDVTEDLGIDNKVVPGGTNDVDMFAFEMTYEVTDTLVYDAEVCTVFVTVLDKYQRVLSQQDVQGTVGALYINIENERVLVSNIQANPIAIPVETASNNAAIIEPTQSATLVVGVNVRNKPSVEEISLSIAGAGDVIVKDYVSRQLLGVTDGSTGQPIDGRFRSRPLVILSSNFQEYVHNYPNPFQAGKKTTRITYFLNSPGNVTIKIYTLTGNLVFDTSFRSNETGPLEYEWNGRNKSGEVVRNGIYICKIQAGSNSATFRIAVAK